MDQEGTRPGRYVDKDKLLVWVRGRILHAEIGGRKTEHSVMSKTEQYIENMETVEITENGEEHGMEFGANYAKRQKQLLPLLLNSPIAAERVFCGKCGREINEIDRYCRTCGRKLYGRLNDEETAEEDKGTDREEEP